MVGTRITIQEILNTQNCSHKHCPQKAWHKLKDVLDKQYQTCLYAFMSEMVAWLHPEEHPSFVSSSKLILLNTFN
jgi:hypothetical protein